MAEWSKAHAWKVCNRQKRFMGSNPILSAIQIDKSRGEARDFFIKKSPSFGLRLFLFNKTRRREATGGIYFHLQVPPQGSRSNPFPPKDQPILKLSSTIS